MPGREENYHKPIPDIGFDSDKEAASADDDPSSQDEASHRAPEDYYIIEDAIAEGGLKIVHRARDRRTGRTVAMAQLRPELKCSHNDDRILVEARILSKLDHANIVPLHDVNYKKDGSIFFIMKLLSGETLHSILKKLKNGDSAYIENFPRRRLLEIFMRVCDAVNYAHSKGIVHLDLKPSNIQVSEFGEVYVVDWGLAKEFKVDEEDASFAVDLPDFLPLVSSKDDTGYIAGTPPYMSPEQSSGANPGSDPSSDIFSLGAILYTIIYFKEPFHKLSHKEILDKLKNQIQPEFPANSYNKTIPNALIAITKKAMMSKVERYQSVSILQKDINLYINNFTTEAEDINLIQVSKLFFKRHNKKLGIVAAFSCVLGFVIYSSKAEVREKDEELKEHILKIYSTTEETIEGILKKHEQLRQQHQYTEILDNYKKLKKFGYDYPVFWYDQAKLWVGEQNFQEAMLQIKKIQESDSKIKNEKAFIKMVTHCNNALKTLKSRALTYDELMVIIINMDIPTQLHAFYKVNRDPETPIEKRLENLADNLIRHNKTKLSREELNFKYELSDNNHLKLDLSNNPKVYHGTPLYGFPIKELSLNNSGIHHGILKDYLKTEIDSLDISNTNLDVSNAYTDNSQKKKLIARNLSYSADHLYDAPKLVYLDIQGSNLPERQLQPSKHIEHLNIAFSNINNFNFLRECSSLKKLILGDDTVLPKELIDVLKSRNVEIVYKQRDLIKIPGSFKAKDYISISGAKVGIYYINDQKQKYVGWLDPGDFVTYDIHCEKAGKYKVQFELSGTFFKFKLKDKHSVLCSVDEVGNGHNEKWKTVSREITLPKGDNTLTIVCTGKTWNIRRIKIDAL